ncbi:MAG: hypothetical protein LBU74_06925 [Methanobacteriaceae archaeon]|jgi:hypothetical protein|nr:hypothetical protein [Candidatus Methanorudis spinitermitis]
MNKKMLIVSIFTLLILAVATTGVVFAADVISLPYSNDQGTITANNIRYSSDNWNWQDNYGKDAIKGSGNCNLTATKGVYVIGNPVTKSGSANEWYIQAKLPENVKIVAFELWYQVEVSELKGKPTTTYVTTIQVTGDGVLDLNKFCTAWHSGKINSVALNNVRVIEKEKVPIYKLVKVPVKIPIKKAVFKVIEIPVYKTIEVPLYKPVFKPIYKPIFEAKYVTVTKEVITTVRDPIYEEIEVADFGAKKSSVTAFAGEVLVSPGTNHFNLAKLDKESLIDGVTLTLVVGNKNGKVGEAFAQLVDNKLVLSLIEGKGNFGVLTFTAIPTEDNYNPTSDVKHNINLDSTGSNQYVMDCPDTDTFYLYMHFDSYQAITGYHTEKTDKIIDYNEYEVITYEDVEKFAGWEYKGLSNIVIGKYLAGFEIYDYKTVTTCIVDHYEYEKVFDGWTTIWKTIWVPVWKIVDYVWV